MADFLQQLTATSSTASSSSIATTEDQQAPTFVLLRHEEDQWQSVHADSSPPSKALLPSNGQPRRCAHLLVHANAYYVWKSSPQQNVDLSAAQLASHLQGKQLASSELQGRESVLFKALFSDWVVVKPRLPLPPPVFSSSASASTASSTPAWSVEQLRQLPISEELDIVPQLKPVSSTVAAFSYDTQTGEMQQLPPNLNGHFWSNSCFVLVQIREDKQEPDGELETSYYIYFYQGRQQKTANWSRFLLATKPILEGQIRARRGHAAKIFTIRVPEGLESPQFLDMLQNRISIHLGEYSASPRDPNGAYLYSLSQLRDSPVCVAREIPLRDGIEQGEDVLVLLSKGTTYVHQGPHANVTLEETMSELVESLYDMYQCDTLSPIEDSSSQGADTFFAAVSNLIPRENASAPGGPFPKLIRLTREPCRQQVVAAELSRVCWNALHGSAATSSASYLLDAFDALYLRPSPQAATESDKKLILDTAQLYQQHFAAARSIPNLQLIVCEPGQEHPGFCEQFPDWKAPVIMEDPRTAREIELRRAIQAQEAATFAQESQHKQVVEDILSTIPKLIDLSSFELTLDFDAETDHIIDQLCGRAKDLSAFSLKFDSTFLSDCLEPIVV